MSGEQNGAPKDENVIYIDAPRGLSEEELEELRACVQRHPSAGKAVVKTLVASDPEPPLA